MRRQPTTVQTGRRKKIGIFLASMAIVILIIAALLIKVVPEIKSKGKFVAPPFDVNALEGVPIPDESYGYSGVQAAGTFKFMLDSRLHSEDDNSLYLHFTNPEESEIWMMVEVIDTTSNVLYKSGIIKNGEYIEKLDALTEMPEDACNITILVYGYEPETYYSMGIVQLNTVLQSK